jgi:hypothetical protein
MKQRAEKKINVLMANFNEIPPLPYIPFVIFCRLEEFILGNKKQRNGREKTANIQPFFSKFIYIHAL